MDLANISISKMVCILPIDTTANQAKWATISLVLINVISQMLTDNFNLIQ